MLPIQLLDKKFVPYIEEKEILRRIQLLAAEINESHANKNPLLISVLNGSFMFTSDLMKQLNIPCEVCFVKLASYSGTQSTGAVRTAIGLETDITNRHLIVLEDIIDTGNTLAAFLPTLQAKNPASLQTICLISKPDALQQPIVIDKTCFEIPNDFIVGYGLDYDGYGRNLKDIYILQP